MNALFAWLYAMIYLFCILFLYSKAARRIVQGVLLTVFGWEINSQCRTGTFHDKCLLASVRDLLVQIPPVHLRKQLRLNAKFVFCLFIDISENAATKPSPLPTPSTRSIWNKLLIRKNIFFLIIPVSLGIFAVTFLKVYKHPQRSALTWYAKRCQLGF